MSQDLLSLVEPQNYESPKIHFFSSRPFGFALGKETDFPLAEL